ncbi:unnamed protein product [Rhizoctonia solani]|uniref:Uncharacterized protein n=1 Tax=Rhizoctonia solani TaxID=456999 RepID=A0A8H3C161_9AGAM|nr:unnamed protein product [Rhizoctonia solani]
MHIPRSKHHYSPHQLLSLLPTLYDQANVRRDSRSSNSQRVWTVGAHVTNKGKRCLVKELVTHAPTLAAETTPTSTPATMSPDRLIPFAKDHDRLQLALLYIEAECNRYKETEVALNALRIDEGIIQQCLEKYSKIREAKISQYIHKHHPANYIDSTGQPVEPISDNGFTQNQGEIKGWRDPEMERAFEMERADLDALATIQNRIKEIEEERARLSERAAQKEELLKLVEELYATAFDGATPEFPHEDQLEALVEIAEIALKGEQAILDKLHQEDGLVELEQAVNSVEKTLDDISAAVREIFRKFKRERPIVPTIFFAKELWKLKVIDLCKTAAQQCQVWKERIDNHFSRHPDTTLSPSLQTKIPLFDSKELTGVFFRAVPITSIALFSDVHEAQNEIQTAIHTTKQIKGQAEISVTKAKTILTLRRHQLAAARSQILDHVIDPDKCPLEQRAERLPNYPEQISIYGLPRSHPLVSSLLAESETYSADAHLKEIVKSRLNRARRTTHPPVLLSSRYQPPMYDELDDPELLKRHYERDIPLVDGATPEYSAKPDYGGHVQTDTNEMYSTIQAELDDLVAEAREQLGLKSEAQRDEFNDMVRTVMGILEGSGINLIMPGPRVHF